MTRTDRPADGPAGPVTAGTVTADSFARRYPFPLDDFQIESMEALDGGESVLVAAPTGSGKTVVAEYAVARALGRGQKAFYTTPLKALSNQKFGDFVEQYGEERVGLLTGDNSINSEAPVVVMTTEVLRNMLYERSPTLEGLAYVVMDEVHYLQDPYRGAVWEEVLIHLPPSVDVVCLSATISNAEEFGEWIGTLRGATRVIIEERRPVPLEHHYLIGRDLHPMHVEEEGRLHANPYIVSLDQHEVRSKTYYGRSRGAAHYENRRRPREGHRRIYAPRREDVVNILDEAGMLPAIYFVFSRAGCDRSVEYVTGAGIRLTSREESERIREFAEERAAWMDEDDLSTLGFYEFCDALSAGVAAHHAGMLPLFKETVEDLFEQGLVRVVFATETLSLGINMPARTVVIEDLWKFQGERHELLTPGEYTQLTGRAGRRGIDELGHAVVLYQQNVNFERVAALASTRTYELTSSFRPSYNMAVNLVRNYSREQTHRLLNSSFGQFLADRSVVTVERQMDRDRRELEELRGHLECDRGNFIEYWELRGKAKAIREKAKQGRDRTTTDAVKKSLASLHPGDVVFVPAAGRRGLAAVVTVRQGKPLAVTQERKEIRLLAKDFTDRPQVLAKITLPRSGRSRSGNFRRDVAASLAALDVRPPRRTKEPVDRKGIQRATELERRAKEHPCGSCPDLPEHERWAVRSSRLAAVIDAAGKRVKTRTETLGKRFDRVLEVLDELEFVEGFTILPKGDMLAHIYGESDILVVQAIQNKLFADLQPAEVAALVSTMIFEPRERFARPGEMPTDPSVKAFRTLSALWSTVRRSEESHRVELCRELELGFATPVFHWANARPLEEVLGETRMTPGDFVRNCKQLLDLLRQIEEAAPHEAGGKHVRAAREAINRGVVAYTGL